MNKIAVTKVHSPLIYTFYEVEKTLSNKRAEIVSELKSKPVIYYDFLLSQEDGIEFERDLRTEILNYDDRVMELNNQLKNYVNILESKFKQIEHENI